MIEQIAKFASPLLEFPIIRRTRRNHGLEHATVHLLASRAKGVKMAGRSSDGGFIILGNVKTADVESAAHDALQRMRNGEHQLAVHPNCGTNLVTTGGLTTLAGLLGLRTSDKPLTLDRVSWTMVLMVVAILFAQPLGMKLQKHITTKGDPGDLEILEVRQREVNWPFSGRMTVHQVITRNG